MVEKCRQCNKITNVSDTNSGCESDIEYLERKETLCQCEFIFEYDDYSKDINMYTVSELIEMLNNTESIANSYFYNTLEESQKQKEDILC